LSDLFLSIWMNFQLYLELNLSSSDTGHHGWGILHLNGIEKAK
jgi:hypothetical protein